MTTEKEIWANFYSASIQRMSVVLQSERRSREGTYPSGNISPEQRIKVKGGGSDDGEQEIVLSPSEARDLYALLRMALTHGTVYPQVPLP